ncbi:hypothetical protein NDU88_003159 [Pleurodeles waltl]|uniref:Uncharacterized protein n=1 Tax=Pleurodeles waltl TaxID=8319 RepID=A0AAV7NHB1_PLEWA|nr:hypothetical protein NDU88_003159 [Pleurodeles waltl]
MDRRVRQALALLKEAGRLDLLAAPVAPKERPVRKAASGVAVAVVACSPPRERTQVSRAVRGRSGRLALAARGRVKAAPKGRPRPLGARRPLGRNGGAAGGTAGNSPAAQRRGQRGAPSGLSVGRGEGAREERPRSEAGETSGGPEEHREGKREGKKISTGRTTQLTGTKGAWGMGPAGGEENKVLAQETGSSSSEEGAGCPLGRWYGATGETGVEVSHILEWSDVSEQEGGGSMDEEATELKVRPPTRTYGVAGRSEAGLEGFGRHEEGEGGQAKLGAGTSSINDRDVGFLQGSRNKRVDRDPGELLTGLEPWEEEEVLAGPSTASWTGYHRGGKAVRAKDSVQQRATGLGSAPPSGRVSEGKQPGYASYGKGQITPLRRPRVPAAQLVDLLKEARFGQQTGEVWKKIQVFYKMSLDTTVKLYSFLITEYLSDPFSRKP